MATLNTSSNGPNITRSYQNVVNSPPPSGPQASSPTFAQWAVFTVAAPLVSAFQQDGGKESVLKVQTTGEGELVDLIDEFSDGRIQFAFVKVKDPNSSLPKCVLIAWVCPSRNQLVAWLTVLVRRRRARTHQGLLWKPPRCRFKASPRTLIRSSALSILTANNPAGISRPSYRTIRG